MLLVTLHGHLPRQERKFQDAAGCAWAEWQHQDSASNTSYTTMLLPLQHCPFCSWTSAGPSSSELGLPMRSAHEVTLLALKPALKTLLHLVPAEPSAADDGWLKVNRP